MIPPKRSPRHKPRPRSIRSSPMNSDAAPERAGATQFRAHGASRKRLETEDFQEWPWERPCLTRTRLGLECHNAAPILRLVERMVRVRKELRRVACVDVDADRSCPGCRVHRTRPVSNLCHGKNGGELRHIERACRLFRVAPQTFHRPNVKIFDVGQHAIRGCYSKVMGVRALRNDCDGRAIARFIRARAASSYVTTDVERSSGLPQFNCAGC
jgi:hypothetical protein